MRLTPTQISPAVWTARSLAVVWRKVGFCPTWAMSVTGCVLLALSPAGAEPPLGYYDSVDGGDSEVLRQGLHALIHDHLRFPYTSTATDTWDVLELADEDPDDASSIRDVYANTQYPKFGGGGGGYQREHAWPKSYGFPDDGSDNYPYSDMHHLFLADGSYNGSRSNKLFDGCDASCSERPTVETGGVGGGTGLYPGYSNWTETGVWETWIGRRGDVARALLYMDVRYEGGVHGLTGIAEPDLILTDDAGQVVVSGVNAATGYMGRLSVLLAWHEQDPVDDLERQRNEVISSYQGNRNPFIDHPEWVSCVFESECEGGSPFPAEPPPWINEIHYENDGADVLEGFEIAGPAGSDLSGWRVVHHNGNGGGVIDSFDLSGVLEDNGSGYGFLFFARAPLQNGPADALALVAPGGDVVEFLSWEGVLVATSGEALGMTSTDLGVEESGGTPVGEALARVGLGSVGGDFAWEAGQSRSPGAANAGQGLLVPVGVPLFFPGAGLGLAALLLGSGLHRLGRRGA